MGWGLLFLAFLLVCLLPAAWLLRARVARAVGARPVFGAALWTVVFAAVLWAMLAVLAMIVAQAIGMGSGAAVAALVWLALGTGVRLYLPGPDGAKLAWSRALGAALPAALWVWGEAALLLWDRAKLARIVAGWIAGG